MWTDDHRETHKPRSSRYPSDISDEEWAIIEPMLPPPRTGGRRRVTDMREVFNAIRYVNRTGCQWRQLPKNFPPHTTVYRYFWEWCRYGVINHIHQALLSNAARPATGSAIRPQPSSTRRLRKRPKKGGLD